MLTALFTTPENESNELRKAYQTVQLQFADLNLAPDRLMDMAISCTEVAARKNLVLATYYADKEIPPMPEPVIAPTVPAVSGAVVQAGPLVAPPMGSAILPMGDTEPTPSAEERSPHV